MTTSYGLGLAGKCSIALSTASVPSTASSICCERFSMILRNILRFIATSSTMSTFFSNGVMAVGLVGAAAAGGDVGVVVGCAVGAVGAAVALVAGSAESPFEFAGAAGALEVAVAAVGAGVSVTADGVLEATSFDCTDAVNACTLAVSDSDAFCVASSNLRRASATASSFDGVTIPSRLFEEPCFLEEMRPLLEPVGDGENEEVADALGRLRVDLVRSTVLSMRCTGRSMKKELPKPKPSE